METILLRIYIIVCCHLIGDYVLQTRFVAESKGENWYHLFVHCALYCLPFAFLYFDYRLFILFISHFIIDPLKARYHILPYWLDQVLHYAIAFILFW